MTSVPGLVAALADRYRIERELGQGGMATVYLAADRKHDRRVAIKVLRPELAAVLGAERFVQEIKTTAALSHPHILPLFDSGETDGFLYYVMPYVEGETIREKLTRETQFGIDEAVKITTEVADALDYAHRYGVIHRDIKPENILLHDGRPMVMDFGIALAVSAAAGGRMTETGLSLGTPHYMSPEQATADKQITARSDVYSLGAVLYEMLAGEPPHMGNSAQQIIMKIIAEPAQPVTALRRNVPLHVAAALATALEKLPADRFPSAQAFAQALANPMYASAAAGAVASGPRRARSQRLTLTLAAALAVTSGLALWLALRPRSGESPSSRFAIALPPSSSMGTPSGSAMAVSGNGSVLVFAGVDSGGTERLWIKRSGEVDATPIAGTEDGYNPFLSPDGSQLGFFKGAVPALFIVALAGGAPREITGKPMGSGGGSWAADGFIYFDADQAGIERVRPDGSGRAPVVALDATRGHLAYAWPEVLPGNKVLVARVRRSTDAISELGIAAFRIGGGPVVALTRGVRATHLDGHLLVVRSDGVLAAYRLRDGGMGIDSTAKILATDVRVTPASFGGADVATDGLGSLYYVSTGSSQGSRVRLEWRMSDGRRLPADSAGPIEGPLFYADLSPDGRRVNIVRPSDGRRGWVRELPSGAMLPTQDPSPVKIGGGWSADGDSVLVVNIVAQGSEITIQRADGLDTAIVIARDPELVGGVLAMSPDHRWLLAQRGDTKGNVGDLVVLDRQRDSVFRRLIPGARVIFYPRISPDGRWLAYQSLQSGRMQVYVQPFPDVSRGIWQVSVDGGTGPRWSPRGNRLFFTRPSGLHSIFAVDITTSPTFHAGVPREAFTAADLEGVGPEDVRGIGPEGDRILVTTSLTRANRSQLIRIENAAGVISTGAVRR